MLLGYSEGVIDLPKPIPESIVSAPGQQLPVIQKELSGNLGYFDPKLCEIGIEVNQHPVGKHHILLHEMLHLAVLKLKQGGLIKKAPSEEFITYLTGALFPMLAISGLWDGVTPAETEEFLSGFLE